MLCHSVEEFDGKLRGQLRDVRKVEAEVAALKISSLKKFNKGSKLALIDSYDYPPCLSSSLF